MENIDNATKLSSITQPRFRWISVGAVWRFVKRALQAARARHELAGMDDRLRADIGISRGEALFESKRNPWDLETPPDPTRRSRETGR